MKKRSVLGYLFLLFLSACTTTSKKESGQWAKMPEILKNIIPPTFPDSTYNVTDYGAKNDTIGLT